VKTSIAARIL